MPQTIGLLVAYVGGAGTITAGAVVGAVIEVAAVAGSLAYQRKQQKKAKAAASRLRREQQLQAAALKQQQGKLAKLGKVGGFDAGTFSSVNGPKSITSMIRSSVASRRIIYGRQRVGGIWIYPETTGVSNERLNLILALCEGPIDAIESVFFDDEEVTIDPVTGYGTGKWSGTIHVSKHLGNPGDPADPVLMSVSSRWTADHRLEGIAYLYVAMNVNLELFSSIPEISAVVRGKNDILDPRTNTRGYSTNPALCLNDYLTMPLAGPGISPADIDQAALMDAANVCDEIVPTLLATEPRYSCQGAIDLSATVEDNAALFVQAMNGDLIQSGGTFAIQAGQYVVPTFTITLDMLAGGIEYSNLQPRKERANVVKGTFLSEANAWQKFDFPSIVDSAAIAQDGQEVVSDLSLELVGSGSQAQRLANMELRQARRGRSVQLVCSLRAMPARVGSNVILNLGRHFDGDIYRVVESRFSVGNEGAPTVALTLLESHPDIYEWDTSDERQINVPADLNAKAAQVNQPVYSPHAAAHPSLPASITITSLTPGAVIRWSLSAIPATPTDGTAYSGPVSVSAGQTLYARGFRDGYLASPFTAEAYA